jgi:hypothetical protein
VSPRRFRAAGSPINDNLLAVVKAQQQNQDWAGRHIIREDGLMRKAILLVVLLAGSARGNVIIPFLSLEPLGAETTTVGGEPLRLIFVSGYQNQSWPIDAIWWSVPIEPLDQTVRIDQSVINMMVPELGWYNHENGATKIFEMNVFAYAGEIFPPNESVSNVYGQLGMDGIPQTAIWRAWDSGDDFNSPSLPESVLTAAGNFPYIPAIDVHVTTSPAADRTAISLSGVIYREIPEPACGLLACLAVGLLARRSWARSFLHAHGRDV